MSRRPEAIAAQLGVFEGLAAVYQALNIVSTGMHRPAYVRRDSIASLVIRTAGTLG